MPPIRISKMMKAKGNRKMKVLVPFAVFCLIAHDAGAFPVGNSIHRATWGDGRCSSIEQQRQRQSAKKQKPIACQSGATSATCMYARKRTDEEYNARKEQLCQLLCLDQKEIDKLVANFPEALLLDLDKIIAPKSEMLQRKLGIDQKGAGRILSCPRARRLIGAKKETLESKIDYLQNELDLSDKEMAKVLASCPQLLARSIKNHYEPLFNALQTSVGFTQEEIAKLAMRNPYCLYTPESDLKESYEWILNLLGGIKSVAARVCQNKPRLLTYSADLLQDKVDWYRHRLSLTNEEIRKVVAQYPSILVQSIKDGKMDKKISYLQQLFDLNDKELKELFLSRPELAASSTEKNIEPKLELYGSLIGKERARKIVVESPYLLLQSMKKRIKPRLEEVDKAYEYVQWTETLLRRLVIRQPKLWCDYMLDDVPRAKGEKLDDSGKYKRCGK